MTDQRPLLPVTQSEAAIMVARLRVSVRHARENQWGFQTADRLNRAADMIERLTAEQDGWQPIESAPAAAGTDQDRILICGGRLKGIEMVLPDGDYWRERKAAGATMLADFWRPLPTPPANILDSTKEAGHE